MRGNTIVVLLATWLGAAASGASANAAPFTLLEYSDTEFASDIGWWSRFTPFMDPDNLPERPERGPLQVWLPFYVAPEEGYYEVRDDVRGRRSGTTLFAPGSVNGFFSLAFSVDATGQIHSASFSGHLELWGQPTDYFSWSAPGRYRFQYEYEDVTCAPVGFDDCLLWAGWSGETHGTWSIVDSSPPPSAIPLPSSSTLLLTGVLLATSARFLRRGRS